MVIKEEIVDCLGVTSTTELSSGRNVYAVTFGKTIPLNDDIRSRLPAEFQGAKGMKEIGATILQIFFNFDTVVPYKVGSKWKISVNEDNGEISLKEAR